MRRILFAVVITAALFAGCSTDEPSARERDEDAAGDQLSRYLDSQPTPEFDWSQVRQNLIEIETAMVSTVQTTSFFFNQGTDAPIGQCPSIGFPIPTTFQLTNPEQISRNSTVLPQAEQTGVFTGDSTGTYVMCVNGEGQAYAFYWEGFVSTVTGAAEFTNGEITLVGEPTFDFSEEE